MKDLKILVCVFVIFFLLATAMFAVASKYHTQRAYKLYKQGLVFSNKGDYQNAYFNFSKISRFSKIYHIALLKQGFCALQSSDYKIAYKKFNHLSIFSNDEFIAPVALYNAALIDIEQDKKYRAFKKLKKLYDKYPKSEYKIAAAYHLGMLYKDKNPSFAKDYLMEYIENAPNGRYVLSAIGEALKLNVYLFDEDKYCISYALYKNGKLNDALELSKNATNFEGIFTRALIYDALNSKKNAFLAYAKALSTGDNSANQKDISTAVSRYIQLSGLSKKDACKRLLKFTKNTSSYPAVLYEYASVLPDIEAIKCYEVIYKKYPDSYQAAQSMWYVFYNAYSNNYNTKAKEIAKSYLERYSNKNSTPAIKYWYAKILLREGKTKLANSALRELIKTEPNSYYAYIAYNLLMGTTTPFNTPCCEKIRPSKDFSLNDLKQIFNNKTLITLALFDDTDLLKSLRLQDNFILSYIAYKDGDIPYSVYLATKALNELQEKPKFDDARYRLAFPETYVELINKYSLKYSQNPYLILSLIREESNFNPKAQSVAGAAGLMQLMPATASSLTDVALTKDALFSPELNIALGTKYFTSLREMFDGCEMLAVLSYNGGPANVTSWKTYVLDNDFDEFVEGIPYFETQNYIKKVFGSYWNYTRIYAKQ